MNIINNLMADDAAGSASEEMPPNIVKKLLTNAKAPMYAEIFQSSVSYPEDSMEVS